jgi:hypothetical protein
MPLIHTVVLLQGSLTGFTARARGKDTAKKTRQKKEEIHVDAALLWNHYTVLQDAANT